MADPKEFQSLDELFRKTFDDLPETPAQNGWDRPSDKVWDHVKTRIEVPRTGWSAQALTMVSAFAVILTVGLYLFFSRPGQTESPAQITAPAPEQAVAIQLPAAPEQAVVEAAPPEIRMKSPGKPKQPRMPGPADAKKSPDQEVPATVNPTHRPGAALPLPGSKRDSPNTKERLLNGAWRTPFRPLPILRQQPAVPAVPASLRYELPEREN